MSPVVTIFRMGYEIAANAVLFVVACAIGAFLVPGLCLLRLISAMISLLLRGTSVQLGPQHVTVVIGAGTPEGSRVVKGLAKTGCQVIACDQQVHLLHDTFKSFTNVRCSHYIHNSDSSSVRIAEIVRETGKVFYSIIVIEPTLNKISQRGGSAYGSSSTSSGDVSGDASKALAAPPIAGKSALNALHFHTSEDALRERVGPSLFHSMRLCRDLVPLLCNAAKATVATPTVPAVGGGDAAPAPAKPSPFAFLFKSTSRPRVVFVRPDAKKEDNIALHLLSSSKTSASAANSTQAKGGVEATNRLFGETVVSQMTGAFLNEMRTHFSKAGVRIVEVQLSGCGGTRFSVGKNGELIDLDAEETPVSPEGEALSTSPEDTLMNGKKAANAAAAAVDPVLNIVLHPSPKQRYVVPSNVSGQGAWTAQSGVATLVQSAVRVNDVLMPTAFGLRDSVHSLLIGF